MVYAGGCLCGAIRYELQIPSPKAIHCYCAMCRKAHGTAFSTHVVVQPDQLSWVQGKSRLKAYESSPDAYREFCERCGTHLLVHGQTVDDIVAIPAGTLDGDPPLTILGHMYTESLVSWFQIADDLPQHAQWPPGIEPKAGT